MAIKPTPTRRARQATRSLIRILVTGDKGPLHLTPTRDSPEPRMRKRANGNQTDTHETGTPGDPQPDSDTRDWGQRATQTDTHESLNRGTTEERDKEPLQQSPTRAATEARMRKRANGNQTDTHEAGTPGDRQADSDTRDWGQRATPTDTHESRNRSTNEEEGKWQSNRHPRTAQPNHQGGKGQRARKTDTHDGHT